jgi:fatty-acyl-CoA synthase
MRSGETNIRMAAGITVGTMLRNQALCTPSDIAVVDGNRELTYKDFNLRVNRIANLLVKRGLKHGDRIAVCSENRAEYLELVFAAAKLGAILCALNWRLALAELGYCVELVAPKIAFASGRFHASLKGIYDSRQTLLYEFGSSYEQELDLSASDEPEIAVDPEDGLLIIYTSGTTGRPKAALMSHRAEIARMLVNTLDFGLAPGDAFVAWQPMFHMVSTEQCIHVICLGGTAVIVDGFDLEKLVFEIENRKQWWLIVMPGMSEVLLSALRDRRIVPKGIKLVGVMADLLPRQQIAELTALLQAPFANTFGSTETGLPPASAGKIPVGTVPTSLAKQLNKLCEIRLVDADGNDVADDRPGELAFRGPTLFSGYWNAPAVNDVEFRGGWFHMGDMFTRTSDGHLNFTDRAKYMIKSGGENVYPAEIERVLLASPRVRDAVVVRRPDERWGEVPVAVVVPADIHLTSAEVIDICRQELAGYKRPKDVLFVEESRLPRSVTGKILRHEIEKWADILLSKAAGADFSGGIKDVGRVAPAKK